MSQIVMTKEHLLARLREQKAVAETYDREAKARHVIEEREALEKYRKNLRAAAKRPLQQVKARGYDGQVRSPNFPSCPRSMATEMRRHIDLVSMSEQKAYTMADSGVHSGLFEAVRWTPTPLPLTVC